MNENRVTLNIPHLQDQSHKNPENLLRLKPLYRD